MNFSSIRQQLIKSNRFSVNVDHLSIFISLKVKNAILIVVCRKKISYEKCFIHF